jgi:hydroxymethylglutaryl-CoA lyase/(R)-citramalyl-CoA lyase
LTQVTLCDVGPRDGLQNEADVLPASARADLVNRLAAAGLPAIEAASFVHPERVPQMADALHFNIAATESFGRRNANASPEEALAVLGRIQTDRPVSVSISVAFGCPFEGPVDPGRVLDLAERATELGAEEVVLADTIGVAVPRQVRSLVAEAATRARRVGIHLHNTRNTGFANAYAALGAGATLFESSVGGLGGCPFAPRATGNVATEDLVYLLHGEGVETGIDLDALIAVAEWLEGVLSRELPGQVYRAGSFPSVAS